MKKLLLFLLISLTGFSQNKINYKKSDGLLDITPYISYLADSTEKLTFEQVINLPASTFKANGKVGLNLGNTEVPYWFKIDFDGKNNSEELFVVLESPELRTLDYYTIDYEGRIESQYMGLRKPFVTKYLSACNFIVKVPNQTKHIYIRIATKSMFLPFYLGPLKSVFKFTHYSDLGHGLLFGFMLALATLNFILFIFFKDKVFLFYSLFLISSLLLIAKTIGILYEFLWFKEPLLIFNENANFSSFLVCIAVYFYTTRFLNTKIFAPYFHKFLKVFCILFIVLISTEFLPYKGWITDICQFLYIIYCISILICGIYVWRIGYDSAKYFVIAWFFYILGIVSILLSTIGIIPFSGLLFMHSWKYGQVLEALLMAFAVAYRFNLFRQEARDAQALVLQRSGENEQLLLAHNQILEEKLQLEEKISSQKPENKVNELLERLQLERGKNKKLAVSTIEGVLLLPIPDIIRLEALGSYCNIFLANNKKIIASKNIAEFEPQLDKSDFLRIHKSHIVNINFIERYIRGEGGMVIMQDGAEVSVSRTMKTELLAKLNIS